MTISASESEFNPFQAPDIGHAQQELRLTDDDEYLVTRTAILCREKVELPKICIHLGETEELVRREKSLQILSPRAIAATVVGAAAFFAIPMWLAFSYSSTRLTIFAEGMLVVFLLGAFAAVVWWSAKHGLYKVDAVWYTCDTYNKRMRWQRWGVRIALVGLTIWGVSDESNSWWTIILVPLVVGLVSLSFNPETGLQLKGKRDDAFVLAGHSKKFHEAVLRFKSGFWEQ